jgi:hypothetical protein
MMDDYSEDYTHTTPLSRPLAQRRPQNNLTPSAQYTFIAIFGYGFLESNFRYVVNLAVHSKYLKVPMNIHSF